MNKNSSGIGWIIFFIVIIVLALFARGGSNKDREKYYEQGYEAAKDDVWDWLDRKHGYYQDIYSEGYHEGYSDGYNRGYEDGSDNAFWIGYEEGLNGVEY